MPKRHPDDQPIFRRRALRYGEQVGFTKMDAARIRRIKKSAFTVGVGTRA